MLGERANQVDRQRDDVVGHRRPSCSTLAATPGDAITEAGLRNDVNVGIQYISSWLRGNGAAGIYGLMEDAATAEIARSQVWQWIRHGVELDDGRTVTPRARAATRDGGARADPRARSTTTSGSSARAARAVARALRAGRPGRRVREFLTLPAYERLD